MGSSKSAKAARAPIVPAKVKVAILALFQQPKLDLESAAQAAGITTYRLREAMKKAHVRNWIWHEKRALIDALCAGNPAALKEIRDTSGNDMARVSAVKAAELMRAETEEATRGAPGRGIMPGLVVIFESPSGETDRTIGPATMPLIEAKPMPVFNPELEPADR
jgi:hypothetical protein